MGTRADDFLKGDRVVITSARGKERRYMGQVLEVLAVEPPFLAVSLLGKSKRFSVNCNCTGVKAVGDEYVRALQGEAREGPDQGA